MNIAALVQFAESVGGSLIKASGVGPIVEIAKIAADLIGKVSATVGTHDQATLDTTRTALEQHIKDHEARTFASLEEAARR